MAYFNYTILPTAREDALNQFPGLEGNGHISCIYQPFQKTGGIQSLKYVQCEKCLGCYSQNCRILDIFGDGSKWICKFCNAYNRWEDEMKLVGDTYTVRCDASEPVTQTSTIIIIDTICAEEELYDLKEGVKNVVLGLTDERFAVISLNCSGDVTLHSSCSVDQNLVFSVNHSNVVKHTSKLDEGYFMKHIRNAQDKIWFETESEIAAAFTSLKLKKSATDKKRPKRATGLAIFLAAILSKLPTARTFSHILSFLAGPCTKGPGKVISRDCKQHIRQQRDFNSNSLKYYYTASKFYESLSQKYPANYEIFVSCLDQVGISEMSALTRSSMAVQQVDSFSDLRFQETLKSYVELRNLHSVYDSQIKIVTSETLLIDGAPTFLKKELADIFPGKTKYNYSDTPRGVSSTNNWSLESPCVLNPSAFSVPFSFTPSTKATKSEAETTIPEHVFIQFQLRFKKRSQSYLRVHTQCLFTLNHPNLSQESVIQSFNVGVEVSYIMKLLSYEIIKKSKYTDSEAHMLLGRLEMHGKELIKKTSPETFIKYLYHLRKTPILCTRNASPDERALYVHDVMNKSLQECLSYCRPIAMQVKEGQFSPVELTQHQLDNPQAMFIDGGTFLVIRYSISDDEDTFAAKAFALQQINLIERFPKPRLIETKVNGSQDRFLKSKLMSTDTAGANILTTQDISFNKFIKSFSKTI